MELSVVDPGSAQVIFRSAAAFAAQQGTPLGQVITYVGPREKLAPLVALPPAALHFVHSLHEDAAGALERLGAPDGLALLRAAGWLAPSTAEVVRVVVLHPGVFACGEWTRRTPPAGPGTNAPGGRA